jgi:hypothetical protein
VKAKTISVLIVLAILASGLMACTAKGGYLIQVMKIAPEDTIVVSCNDYEAAAEDSDWEFIYDGLETIMALEPNMRSMVGDMDTSDVSASAVVITTGNDIIFVLIGDFNLEDIRDALIEGNWIEDEYEGIEIWTLYDYKAIAFIDNMIVSGNKAPVEACICAHKNEEPSMYDNEYTRAVADKLPVVPSSVVSTADYTPMVLEDYLSDIEYLAYSIGISNENRDDEVLDISAWLKFDSEASAEAALEDIEDNMETVIEGITNIDASLNGQFIEITGEMEIP